MAASITFPIFNAMDSPAFPDTTALVTITTMKMPFGKYKGTVLSELPVFYLEWFARKGFPAGKIGMLLSTVYEIKLNGLEYLLQPLKRPTPGGAGH